MPGSGRVGHPRGVRPTGVPGADHRSMQYEIRVDGHMSETLVSAFPELEHVVISGQTVLYGPVVDEAHLYGLLARFQSLGLHVVELRRLPE